MNSSLTFLSDHNKSQLFGIPLFLVFDGPIAETEQAKSILGVIKDPCGWILIVSLMLIKKIDPILDYHMNQHNWAN